MSKSDNLLNNIKIASPCSANWNEMMGNERKRYCGECKLNVYNLSEMTKAQAENFILKSEGSACVRIYKRADGTVLTKDCPVGWAKIRQRTRVFATAALSLIVNLFSGLLFASVFTGQKEFTGSFPIAFATPPPEPHIMGEIAMPSPTPKQMPTPKATPRGEKPKMIMGKVAVVRLTEQAKD